MTAMLDRVRPLLPAIAERAEEIEATRAVPLDLVEDLRAAGAFRMYVPRVLGGDELSLGEGAEVIEAIARADASAGWIVAIGAGFPSVLCFLPPETYRNLYAGGPDLIVAGAVAPTGRAVVAEGGYRFSGQWAFASGCCHASHLVAAGIVVDNGEGRPGSSPNIPEVRIGVFPIEQCEILDTWYVSGLKGTGSNDFRLDDVFVPTGRTGAFFGATPTVHHPADVVPMFTRVCLDHAEVALGIGQGALDDLIAIAETKRAFGVRARVADDPVFRHRVGRITAELSVLRSALWAVIDEVQALVDGGGTFTTEVRAKVRTTAVHVTERTVALVDACFAAGGTTGLYESSPLQRRLRDIRALAQHVSVSPNTFTTAGAVWLGEPADTAFL